MKALFKRYVFSLLSNPLSYIVCAASCLYFSFDFFAAGRFFSSAGTTDMRAFFASIPKACVLAVPALAAALPSWNKDLGLPYGEWTPGFARILSVLAVLSVPLVLSCAIPVAASFFGDVECAQVLCGYLGICLYLICAVSLCVFALSFFKSGAAAFPVCALFLAAANYAHLLPLYVRLPSFASSLLRSISFAWRFDTFGKGIIDSRDVLFYAAVSGLLYLFSVCVQESRRGGASPFFKKERNLIFAGLVLVLAVSPRVYFRTDTTASKKFSISAYSKSLVSRVTEPLSVDYYLSPRLTSLYPQVRDVTDYLASYCSLNPKISFLVHNPSKNGTAQKLESAGIAGRTIQTAGETGTSFETVYSAVTLSYLGRTEIIPFVMGTDTLEYDLGGRISALADEKVRIVQVACGNGLSLDEDYSYIIPWLESQGFSVLRTAFPSMSSAYVPSFASYPKIPLVVIGASEATESDCDAFRDFVLEGGRAFAAVQPYTVDIKNDWQITQDNGYFSQMLGIFGINLMDSVTSDVSNFRLTMTSDTRAGGTGAESRTEYVNYSQWPVLLSQTCAPRGMTLFWPSASVMDTETGAMEGYSLSPLLVTSPASWQEDIKSQMFTTNPFFAAKAAGKDQPKSSFTVAVQAVKRGDSVPSLIVLGDQYALHSGMIAYSSSSVVDMRSLEFLSDSVLKLNAEEALAALKNKNSFNKTLYKIPAENLAEAAKKAVASSVLIPLAVIIAAAVIFIIKRRRFNK